MAMIRLKDVAWMSINVSGSCVNVSLKEKAKQPELVSKGEPCNIVAKCSGQIEKVETDSGTACVNTNDVVTEGQLLISGIVENLNSENSFVCAEGKVFAKVRKNIVQKIEINQTKAKDTGKVIKKYDFYATYYKITIDDKDYIFTFGVMLIASLITGNIANKMKVHTKESLEVAYRTKILFETNKLLQKAENDDEIIKLVNPNTNILLVTIIPSNINIDFPILNLAYL